MSVFLANEQADYRVDEPSLARLARLVMDAEGVEESEISLLLVDRSVMTDLNERYMGEDRPTDVLAFPIDGPSPASGPPDGPSGPRGFAADRLGEGDDEDALEARRRRRLLDARRIVSARPTRPSRPTATAEPDRRVER